VVRVGNNRKKENNGCKMQKYITFNSHGTLYGINLHKMKELIALKNVKITNVSADNCGMIIQVRDKIIPVRYVDEAIDYKDIEETNESSVIIVVETYNDCDGCWVSKKCEKPECPAYLNTDIACWTFEGTHCQGTVQGTYYDKIENCMKCEFFKNVHKSCVSSCGFIINDIQGIIEVDLTAEQSSDSSKELTYPVIYKEDGVVVLLNTALI
jgi:chemotaxis signal transduction protein